MLITTHFLTIQYPNTISSVILTGRGRSSIRGCISRIACDTRTTYGYLKQANLKSLRNDGEKAVPRMLTRCGECRSPSALPSTVSETSPFAAHTSCFVRRKRKIGAEHAEAGAFLAPRRCSTHLGGGSSGSNSDDLVVSGSRILQMGRIRQSSPRRRPDATPAA